MIFIEDTEAPPTEEVDGEPNQVAQANPNNRAFRMRAESPENNQVEDSFVTMSQI